MTTIRCICLITLCTLALPAGAQVYKWVDKDGKVHYTSQKPADAKAEELAIKSANSLGGNAEPVAAPAPATAAAAKPAYEEADAAAAALKKEVDSLNQQRCNTAKSIAARYDSAPFLEKTGADGSKVRLAPEEEAAERARMKGQVTSACAVSGGGS